MKFYLSFLFVFCIVTGLNAQNRNDQLRLIEVKKIWDEAEHNAFTDLIRFNDRWYCVFREGKAHVSKDGSLRVISSKDGEGWTSEALITSADSDLRDAKITVTPDGQLMLSGAEAFHDKSEHTHQSLSWFSNNGTDWSKGYEIGDPDFWLWGTTWYKESVYSIGYACNEEKSIRLYSSKDGKNFDTLVERLYDKEYPNESSIVFHNDTAFCLLRRGGNGLIGVSYPPYNEWQWKDLGQRIGGPELIVIPDGRFLAAVRIYETEKHPTHTALYWVDPHTGDFREAIKLPSGGDTSYAGMVIHDGVLWVSYYSSHEKKTAIYLAKVVLSRQDMTKIMFQSSVIKKIPTDANQGVAVDKSYYYAISNTKISKHIKSTGELVASWEADKSNDAFQHFTHMNSGTVIDGKLYVAHSRYKVDPNDNTIEIWNVENEVLIHEKSIPMPREHGSLTWVDKREDGIWWMCYAVYGSEANRKTKLVKYQFVDGEFIEEKWWYFPQEVVMNWEEMSCSGGSWGPDGNLYTTGHDHSRVYVLNIKNGHLEYIRTVNNVGFYGQAIAWDRSTEKKELWGIVKRKYVVQSRITIDY